MTVFWIRLFLNVILSVTVHELAHMLAAWWVKLQVTEVHLGIGPPVWRAGTLSVRAWPVGVGIEIPDAEMARVPARTRVISHASGPLSNLLLAAVLAPISWTGVVVNLVLGVSNLLPLPYQDGGWLFTLWRCRGDFAAEVDWHRRMARPLWAVAGVAALTVALYQA